MCAPRLPQCFRQLLLRQPKGDELPLVDRVRRVDDPGWHRLRGQPRETLAHAEGAQLAQRRAREAVQLLVSIKISRSHEPLFELGYRTRGNDREWLGASGPLPRA